MVGGMDYFCYGMVEDIIKGLSRVKWLFVIARNSSFAYKGKRCGREERSRKPASPRPEGGAFGTIGG